MQKRLDEPADIDLSCSACKCQVKTRIRGSEITKNLILLLSLLFAISDISAQTFDPPKKKDDGKTSFWLPAYLEPGQNNITDGMFLKAGLIPTYQFGKYTAQAGIRFNIISNNENFLSGFSLIGSRNFKIRKFDFEVKGIYIRTGYSGVLHENKWGLLESTQTKHFRFGVGTSFRTLALNNDEASNLNDTINTTIHENWNMLYLFSYYIKPAGSKWNINLSITDIDFFNFSQETNPIFKIGALYNVNPAITLFIDSGYENAGLINMNTEFFGFFIKTGVVWKIR